MASLWGVGPNPGYNMDVSPPRDVPFRGNGGRLLGTPSQTVIRFGNPSPGEDA